MLASPIRKRCHFPTPSAGERRKRAHHRLNRSVRGDQGPDFRRVPSAPERQTLYWVRTWDDVDRITGRLNTQVMALGEKGVVPVTVPLRYQEAVSRHPPAFIQEV